MPDRPRQRALLTWLVCASWVASLSAAEVESGARAEQPYRVKRWTTEDGLPQNRISCLKQTRDGYLWLGTWFGLARFDGVRFTVFDKFNTPELVNDAINAVAEDTDGTLWIATADGLVSYREHHFRRLTTAHGLPDRKVWRLTARHSGGVWLQAGDLVTRLEGGKFSQVWNMPLHQDTSIQALHEGADGWLHIVTGHTWLTLSPNADELRTNQVENSSGNAWLTGLSAKQPGSLWVGTQQGLQRWDQSVSKTIGTSQLGQRPVDFIYEDRSTNLWVDTKPGGLFREDHGRWTAVELGESAAPVSTTCMEEDREGNFWLGTDQGLVQLQRRRVRTYTTRDGLVDDHVWSVCEGTDGTIWVGADRGLSRIHDRRVLPLDAGDIYPDHPDRCVWPPSDGGVLIAKSRIGVLEFKERLIQRVAASALPSPNIFALYEDRSGLLWIGTGNGVAALKDGQVTASYTNWAGRSEYDVRCILQDRAGTFWFGTQGQGLTRLRNRKFDVFTERDGLSNNRVWAIHEDADGALWLGTENGLTRFLPPVGDDVRRLTSKSRKRKAESRHEQSLHTSAPSKERGGVGRFFTFRRSQGLLENAVNWILEDDFGYLWLSGLRGIYRVKLEQLNAVAEGRVQSVQVAAFGTADGMESSETNGEGQPAGWKARDGRLWFPTTRGVVVIDPKTVEVNEVPPPVVIEQVKADDEIIFGDGVAAGVRRRTMGQNGNIRLLTSAVTKLAPGRAQVVEISYTANTFVDPKRARFRYRMIGRDSGWRDVTVDRVAHYTNLRPGNYCFEVVAANHHGVWSPTPASFPFALAPHFYETWPFYLLCAAAVIGLALGVQAYRLRWQRRLLKLEEQRALANERTRIARDLHDDLGTALTGLALELDVIGREAREVTPVAEHLGETAQRTRDLAERMREVVWTVNPQCDTLSSLASFLEQQISQFLGATSVRVRLDFPEDIPAMPLAADARHQLALSVREALTNVVRHAHASEVVVSLAIVNGSLIVQVKDNGRGFQPGGQVGNGLANLRARLEQIGGSFECVSTPGAGTTVTFRLPLRHAAAENGGIG
ncbi:MAG: ATP-binding protein [Verrucomicrobia bacterium]|nr:ATP-binding protein [Verrucomicrobiota bacterium]